MINDHAGHLVVLARLNNNQKKAQSCFSFLVLQYLAPVFLFLLILGFLSVTLAISLDIAMEKLLYFFASGAWCSPCQSYSS